MRDFVLEVKIECKHVAWWYYNAKMKVGLNG